MSTININKLSVQSLKLQLKFGQQALATGTGFVVDSLQGPLLITNRHNVTGKHQETGECISKHGGIPDRIEIWHHVNGQLGKWISKIELLYQGEDWLSPRWIEHPKLGSAVDVVALPLSDISNVGLYHMNCDVQTPQIAIAPAEVVSVIGFPFGLSANKYFPIWATGFVASEPGLDYDDMPCFLIDCRSRQGQSGSPVVAFRSGGMIPLDDGSTAMHNGSKERFLGVYSGRIHEQSDIGCVWKASVIREIISSLCTKNSGQ